MASSLFCAFVAGFASGGGFVVLIIPSVLRRALARRDEQWQLADLNRRARNIGK
jgi:hypothetical protein